LGPPRGRLHALRARSPAPPAAAPRSKPRDSTEEVQRAASEDTTTQRARAVAWRRPLTLGEALARLPRSLGRRIPAHDLFEGTLRRRRVAHVCLGTRDVEQRVGHLLAVGVSRQELSLRGDRAAEVALSVLRVALPVEG